MTKGVQKQLESVISFIINQIFNFYENMGLFILMLVKSIFR
jgi:hypothetical protein